MPVSQNLGNYPDVERAFRAALLNPSGALQAFPGDTPEERRRKAVRWRQRAYKFRELLRAQNREAYAGTSRDAEKDTTPYDELVIRLTEHGECKITREGLDSLPPPIGLDGISAPDVQSAPAANDVIDLDLGDPPMPEGMERARQMLRELQEKGEL